ncbi:MAG: ankyrin repeat domain-containing protein, partial [Treponema sp.]|nr:ankyrin repeat domain-containing protein [Treponema sp.]
AKLLIEAGADVNARDKDGRSAVWWAKNRKAKDVIALLKAAGAKE